MVDPDQRQGIRNAGCSDGGGQTISGYRFAADRKGSVPLRLEEPRCQFLTAQNVSRAARELDQWVHARRGTTLPWAGPK